MSSQCPLGSRRKAPPEVYTPVKQDCAHFIIKLETSASFVLLLSRLQLFPFSVRLRRDPLTTRLLLRRERKILTEK